MAVWAECLLSNTQDSASILQQNENHVLSNTQDFAFISEQNEKTVVLAEPFRDLQVKLCIIRK